MITAAPGWFKRIFAKSKDAKTQWGQRRWEAGETNRLNSAKWASAKDTWINDDILAKLATVRSRCALEAARNPFVEGVISTHVSSVVGAKGPTLQIHSDDDRYNTAAERVWREWWGMPDINGQYSGVDILQQWLRSCWVNGEYLCQITNTEDKTQRIAVRLLNLDPRRLATPISKLNPDVKIFMGVERDGNGKPLRYWLYKQPVGELDYTGLVDAEPFDADAIIHGFFPLEPGQARGVPWLAPCLEAISDLREYDAQVLDAARAAADSCVILYSDHPDANYMEVDESIEIERRTQSTAPPGWKPMQIRPEQPHTLYIDYRAERHREIGRPVNMPLMMIRLDSSGHNYSSARFDGQIYQRGNNGKQAAIERHALNRLLRIVLTEARLGNEVPPPPDSEIQYVWTWPTPPHVDPLKEANAEKARLENRTLGPYSAASAHGMDFESVIDEWKRAKPLMQSAGIWVDPKPPEPVGKDEEDEDEETKTKDKD